MAIKLLEMSVSGAVMILVIVVIRALAINRLPKKTFLALWDITLARLLIPYSLPSAISVYSLIGSLPGGFVTPVRTESLGSGVPTAWPVDFSVSGSGALSSVSDVPAAASSATLPYRMIWLVGVLSCAVFFTAVYLKCYREFREALPVENAFALDWLKSHRLRRTIRLRQSDRISAPLTYGLFRPVILLPKGMDWRDEPALEYVLIHEYVHIRRFDAAVKLLLTAAFCVHWFNPVVWVMYVLANRDMELSCDETVIRLSGDHTKSAYAMTLIRMEETRSNPRPLCNNFSKHAIEERITAIMKTKKTTWITVAGAIALVVCVAVVFATTGQTAAAQANSPNSSQADTACEDSTLMAYINPKDGKTYYSRDKGETWISMTDEELNAVSGWKDVEWWTAEEYAAWLEQEKADLQSIIGEQGWNPTEGWYTWTQERAEEAIARYEQTLKDIQAGQKISKPAADGDTMIQFGYDPALQTTITDTTTIDTTATGKSAVGTEATDITAVLGSVAVMDSITDDAVMPGNGPALIPELLADYKAYGLTYDEARKVFYFNGKLVRYFWDGYTIVEYGVATIYDYLNEDGVVDVHSVRQATQNADGSVDPGGRLVGIEAYSQEEFDSRVMMPPSVTQEATTTGFVGSAGGMTFEERFARYKEYGITYVEADGASGRGNVYLNGQLVSHFADVAPNGNAFSFTSAEQGGINVQAVYDSSGNLTGLETTAN